jgi:Domain of Unknown Function (DUF1080).
MISTTSKALTLCIAAFLALPYASAQKREVLSNKGFVPIFDGKSMRGWHVSSQTGHGTGGKWVVENGAITGSQDRPGNGGIVLTDKQYGDFEIALEMRNDYGPDSGLFLRSNEKGQAYQAMIDYHDNGNLMGVYGEGIGGFASMNFKTHETPDKITEEPCPAFPLPFKPSDWSKVWKHGRWNELRARIVGNPPTIDTWINGVKIMHWTDTEKRLPDKGSIALQVHGGSMGFTDRYVRYRNVRVKELGKQ